MAANFARQCRLNSRLRFGTRCATLLMLLFVGYMWSLSLVDTSKVEDIQIGGRSLMNVTETDATPLEEESSDEFERALDDGDEWLLIFYVIGLFYMFYALMIVCDEFFVPCLEVFVEHYKLSNDVAGATFMAAGGSAPELFTSFIGTFRKDDVGFGTIVGSATFNVLFVIGMCAVFSQEVLTLTWWPLFRDCCYYSISLLMLAIFFGISSEYEIEWWEALTLFAMYIGYVTMMMNNAEVHRWVLKMLDRPDAYKLDEEKLREEEELNVAFYKPSTFRAGVLQLMLTDKSILQTAGVAVVAKIKGNVRDTFRRINKSGDGRIDESELRELLIELGSHPTDEQVKEFMAELDTNNDGHVCFEEFTDWYAASEARLQAEMFTTFDKFDTDHSGTIDKHELKNLLLKLGNAPSDAEIESAMKELDLDGDGQIDRDEFAVWYKRSLFWTDKLREIEEEKEAASGVDISWPEHGLRAQIVYVISLPLLFGMYYTIPDVRHAGKNSLKYASIEFIMSICWIGFFAYWMVDWAIVIGDTLSIPSVIMGLTFLAAGTSVPDLLSSVIVAKQGEGDMAVSSSIGSNIFDILVGLPLPWLAYAIIQQESVKVEACSLFVSVLILMGMLVAVVGIVWYCNWRMTRLLGWSMFMLYAVFVVQDIIRSQSEDC
eukprot:Rmarinus@m.13627